MGERDGNSSERKIGSDVTDSMHSSRREDSLEFLHGDRAFVRCLFSAQKVDDCAICGTNDDMDGGNKPRVREIVEDNLVL